MDTTQKIEVEIIKVENLTKEQIELSDMFKRIMREQYYEKLDAQIQKHNDSYSPIRC